MLFLFLSPNRLFLTIISPFDIAIVMILIAKFRSPSLIQKPSFFNMVKRKFHLGLSHVLFCAEWGFNSFGWETMRAAVLFPLPLLSSSPILGSFCVQFHYWHWHCHQDIVWHLIQTFAFPPPTPISRLEGPRCGLAGVPVRLATTGPETNNHILPKSRP